MLRAQATALPYARLSAAQPLRVGQLVIAVGDEHGPAANSDLQSGDLIVGVSDESVDGVDSLHRHLSRWPVGTELTLQVVRRAQTLKVPLIPRSAE